MDESVCLAPFFPSLNQEVFPSMDCHIEKAPYYFSTTFQVTHGSQAVQGHAPSTSQRPNLFSYHLLSGLGGSLLI